MQVCQKWCKKHNHVARASTAKFLTSIIESTFEIGLEKAEGKIEFNIDVWSPN